MEREADRRVLLGFALAVAASLAAVPAAAAPYLQAGGDAARTGFTSDAGPERFDVAVVLDLPGRLAGTPILLDGSVYVATFASLRADDPAQGKNTSALWRIDLGTAEAEPLVTFGAPLRVSGLASDGVRLFTAVGTEVRAYGLDGRPLWVAPAPSLGDGAPSELVCRDGAVAGGVVRLACTARWLAPPAGGGAPVPARSQPFVVALDAATGEDHWRWTPAAGGALLPLLGASGAADTRAWAGALAVLGDHVVVTTHGPGQGGRTTERTADSSAGYHTVVWFLDAGDGTVRGRHVPSSSIQGPMPPNPYYYPARVDVTGDGERVYVGWGGKLLIIDREDFAWNSKSYRDSYDDSGLMGESPFPMPLAVGRDALFLATGASVHRVSLETLEETWKSEPAVVYGELCEEGEGVGFDERSSFLLAGDRLYAEANGGAVHAFDIATGGVVWSATLPNVPIRFVRCQYRGTADVGDPEPFLASQAIAVGDGVLTYVSSDGHVAVFGRTAASIALAPAVADAYPAVGAPARIDVSGTGPGALGPATEHRVVWGDGTKTEWTDTRVFEHAYETGGDHTAVVEARNPAGQTSSVEVLFHVGGTPPPSGLLATALAPQNADVTFGLLGLALTLLGAAIAYTRWRRHGAAVAPLASEDRMEVYRAALEQAVDAEGTLDDRHALLLAALRRRLGITDRDHALLLAAVRGQRRPGSGFALTPGETVLGKYRILRAIGEGSQGQAFHAEDTLLDRQVVVKLLHAERGDEAIVLREARTMASIRHPHVVTIHDVDRLGDRVFIVMERMEGGSLADRLARGGLAPAEFATLAGNLLGALGAVHAAGTLHLDVKPGNILLTADGQAKLADFGVAQRPGLDRTLAGRETGVGPVGTIQYMAPEQARGQMVTRRTDLYGAALVLYEAWTGEPYHKPPPSASPVELQIEIAAGRAFHGALAAPEGVRMWFAHALDPDPARRFAGADEMLASLVHALESRGPEAERR